MKTLNSYLIKNGRIVTAEGVKECDLLVKEGMIAEIGKDIKAKDASIIDAKGMWVAPGLVDIHCHLREPGEEYKEDIASGARAAAKGGFTTICCMANTKQTNDCAVVTEYILKKAREAGPVHVHPIGAVTKGLGGAELAEMGEMAEAGAVAFSDDGLTVKSANMMRLGLNYAKRFSRRIISHPEDLDLAAGGVMNEGYWSMALGLAGKTRAAEETIIARDCMLAELEGTGIHMAHVSTRGGVEIVRAMKARGVDVTAETAPHYLMATDEWVQGYDSVTKVNPPLRTEDDRQALIEALLDGTIDCIATDHAPHHVDDKNVEYAIASSGISGFETALGVCWTALVKSGHLTPEQLFEKMGAAAAHVLNLDTGLLAVGKAADVVIIDGEAEWTVEPEKFLSKGKNTLFGGRTLTGLVRFTMAGGEVAFDGLGQ